MPDLVGQTLKGRYRIESFVGRGGMAEVYKAWDTGRQYHVAIKILREDLAEDLEFVRRFRKEAEALARLDHRNIVRFYSFEREGALAFIVMDFVPGASLRRRIFEAGGQPLGAGEIANTIRQVGRALHYAHAEGFIHRDVKPGNILITPDGQILLSEFGIARGIETSTITQGQVGTPAYMSPEQVTGGELDGRSDIYSLGVVLYKMATGRRPFDGAGGQGATTTERVCWEQMYRPLPDPRAANPALSPAQVAVISRALAKDPAERWPTACRSPLFAHCFAVARRQPRTRRNFATPPYVLVLRRTQYAWPAARRLALRHKEAEPMRTLSLVIVFAIVFTFTAAAAPASAAAANPCPETYIVRWGDTLARIAQRCDISVARLLVANPHIKNPDRIIAGQLLNIPGPREHTTVFRQVKAYLIALGEGTPGNIGCGDAPVAVTRNVRPTTAPLTAAIQELISIRGNYYGQSGLFNPLWQSNLRIQSVTLVSGKATVRLTGTFVIGGPCQGAAVKAQFDRTALQFSTVRSVKVYINGRPLVDILSEEA